VSSHAPDGTGREKARAKAALERISAAVAKTPACAAPRWLHRILPEIHLEGEDEVVV
jgi:hypothetical protein